jgi:hypothetical protein
MSRQTRYSVRFDQRLIHYWQSQTHPKVVARRLDWLAIHGDYGVALASLGFVYAIWRITT